MTTSKEHTQKIAAENKSIGFDFQYYYFLYRLMKLRSGESVGLEVLDDVHTTSLTSNRKVLVQLKHTTQTNADGSKKSLATFDEGFWETLRNWCKIITDPPAGRGKTDEQLRFVKSTDFLFVSNKSDNEGNAVLKAMKEFQLKNISIEDLEKKISDLGEKTSNKNIKNCIQTVLSLSQNIKEAFFNSVDFDLGCDDIIGRCKEAIKEDKIPEEKIETVFLELDSQVRQDIFKAVENKEKIVIDFDTYYLKYRKIYDRGRNKRLEFRPFDGVLPDNLVEQKFIQQLLEIQDITINDHEQMSIYTRHLLCLSNNLMALSQTGELTESEIRELDTEAKSRWSNEFHSAYRRCPDSEIPQRAVALLDAMRKERLPLVEQELSTDMSNGEYYRLTETPEIGWHKDWERKFK